MARDGAEGGNFEEGLHRRETASRIERKFAPAEKDDAARGARKTRRRRSLEGELETEMVDSGKLQSGTIADSSAREGFSPALVTFVAQMIRHGLEAGELEIVDGVVVAVDEISPH